MDDDIRQKNRRQWSAAAEGWTELRREKAGPLTQAILECTHPKTGDMVLDLACGTGDPTFYFAEEVGPSGYVLGLDLTPAMVQGARKAARAQGVTNVAFRVVDSELDLGAAEGHFDVCVCRCGLMFMPDPQGALCRLYAALRPGGRLCVSTWGDPKRAPAFTLLSEIAGRHAGRDGFASPGGPGMFSLDTPEKMRALLEEAGFAGPTFRRVECEIMHEDDAESLWRRVKTSGGPMVHLLKTLSEEKIEAIHQELLAECSRRFKDGPISLGAEALVSSARKPG